MVLHQDSYLKKKKRGSQAKAAAVFLLNCLFQENVDTEKKKSKQKKNNFVWL